MLLNLYALKMFGSVMTLLAISVVNHFFPLYFQKQKYFSTNAVFHLVISNNPPKCLKPWQLRKGGLTMTAESKEIRTQDRKPV